MRRFAAVPVALALVFSAGLPHAIAAGPVPPKAVPALSLPRGVPEAALRAEPPLPVPSGWPFPDAFPRTSGTSRLVAGALEHSDFLYDDHGARGIPRGVPIAGLAPTDGTYEYAPAAAKKNGADIFRVGIGLDRAASYWRVDWTTLADRTIPIASFAIDNVPDAGVAAWPGISNLKATGIDQALIMSAQGAWLIDAATGARTALAMPTVDMAAKSFVLRIPKTVLPATGKWNVRAVSGLADAEGDGFAPVDTDHGALPTQPPVFNAAFRDYEDEKPYLNFWMEDAQAAALALGDVTNFVREVDWARLATGATTPEDLPTGYSNRWYVSSITVGDGQGVVANTGGGTGDLKPNYLGRVQPYAVYVPSSHNPNTPAPLTWILHSLSVQHNQYGATNPKFIQQACEDRGSICATTLGRGPDGWYYDEAELDFWEVWNRLASAYRLDPEATVISGYSMGGWATYKLGLAHPDLFAKAVVLAGPPGCGLRFAQGYGGAGGPGHCTTEGDSTPFVGNATWLPFYMAHGTNDELVPITSVLEHIERFRVNGLRYRFELYPGQDHMAYAVEDGFSSAAAHMGDGKRERMPDTVSYSWYPNLDRPDYHMVATGAYWVKDPKAVVGPDGKSPDGTIASIEATSKARPYATHTSEFKPDVLVPGDPSPAVVTEQTWLMGPTRAAAPTVTLDIHGVASVALEVLNAGFKPGQAGVVRVTSDGPAKVVLRTSKGNVTLTVPSGTTAYPFTA
jgi:pimeloyl-ACP methyl ester carboxylesterase